jgi:hypothetical protein
MCQSISKKLIIIIIKIKWHEIFFIVSEMRMHMAAAAALFLCSPATAVLLPKEVQNEKRRQSTDAHVQ